MWHFLINATGSDQCWAERAGLQFGISIGPVSFLLRFSGIALGRIPCISDVKTGNNPKFHCGSLSCQKSPNDTAGGLAGRTRCREFTAASHLCARVASARRAKALQHPDHVLHEVQGAARVSVAAQDSEDGLLCLFAGSWGRSPV